MRGQGHKDASRTPTHRFVLGFYLLGLTGASLTGIEFAGAEDLANSNIDPGSIISSFTQGKVWCTSYRPRDNSCTSVQRVLEKSDSGVEVTVLRGYPFKVKEVYPMSLIVKDGLVCADFSRTVDKYFRYVTSNRNGELLPEDQAFSDREMARYREGLRKSISGLGQVCWSYSVRNETDSGRKIIQVIGYKDGVKQRIDKRETGTFFDKGHSLSFRHPIYKSSK